MLLGKALIHLFTPSLLNTWADWYFVVLISNQSQRRKTKSQTIKEQWNALHYTPLENSWQFTDNKEREALESHNYVHAEGIKHKRKRKKKRHVIRETVFSLNIQDGHSLSNFHLSGSNSSVLWFNALLFEISFEIVVNSLVFNLNKICINEIQSSVYNYQNHLTVIIYILSQAIVSKVIRK